MKKLIQRVINAVTGPAKKWRRTTPSEKWAARHRNRRAANFNGRKVKDYRLMFRATRAVAIRAEKRRRRRRLTGEEMFELLQDLRADLRARLGAKRATA